MNKKNNEVEAVDENKLIAERRKKLDGLRENGIAFPNTFKPENKASEIHKKFGELDSEGLAEVGTFIVAGRMMAKRVMVKASLKQGV